jgi:hypothetical protein
MVRREFTVDRHAKVERQLCAGRSLREIARALRYSRSLKRAFGVEIGTRACCGGTPRIIASIEEPAVIARILSHLQRTVPAQCRLW